MRVEILMYPGVSEVDAVMALHVFQVAARRGADVESALVTASDGAEIEGADAVRFTGLPTWRPAETDVLLVCGGWIHEVIADGTVPRQIAEARRLAGPGQILGGVCAGAVILGAAGLLQGRPATTHHAAFADLSKYTEVVDARIVDDGDVVTAGGGPLSGFDLPLYLLERELGEPRLAAEIEQFIEHDRRGTVWR
ncbi:DJ-1/PfpI family protein [Glycomyces harbinensis]|uniref:DJ-1/PfpI family protein n=1 Tax=Glycomyces harbinensis TaxID=58114 RepID=A0A1G7DGA1_9ACTN|nr:DJ-1/PfpI family protein [Glycomyces harbinensis]SDE49825.1 DJ-1/PfpI family protein [Glycomyces harbinensis]